MILTMGLNHTTAPIEVREQIANEPCIRQDTLDELHHHLESNPFDEQLVLSTCNRTEIYVVTSDAPRARAQLHSLFSARATLSPAADFLYTHTDREAVAHLFAVASGIDSMILGEFEILGQVRRAYLAAAKAGSLGPILHRLFNDAIHIGKRAHSETAIGAGAASVAYGAVALARQHLGSLAGKNALVIGAGEMGRRAAANLAEDGACIVAVTNRTYEHAANLATQIGARVVPFDELAQSLATADLVISATSAPHIVLNAAMIQTAMAARPERSLFLLDIAVPRDIDPETAQVPNVHLANIDDLQNLMDANRAIREQAVDQVRAIIAAEVDTFWHWFAERRAAPVIADLREHADLIRSAELDKALRRLGHLNLNERDQNVIAALSAGIVSKLLAAPTARLKERVQSGDGQVYLDTLRELFDLDERDNKE